MWDMANIRRRVSENRFDNRRVAWPFTRRPGRSARSRRARVPPRLACRTAGGRPGEPRRAAGCPGRLAARASSGPRPGESCDRARRTAGTSSERPGVEPLTPRLRDLPLQRHDSPAVGRGCGGQPRHRGDVPGAASPLNPALAQNDSTLNQGEGSGARGARVGVSRGGSPRAGCVADLVGVARCHAIVVHVDRPCRSM
jgi:hypothetical protein